MSILSTVPKGAAVEGINPNLLRNWYFVGGGTGRGVFPVNSRGQTSYGISAGADVDGWFHSFGSGGVDVNLNSTGLSFGPHNTSNHAGIRQYFDNGTFSIIAGKQVTASFLLSNGSFFMGTALINAVEKTLVNTTYGGSSLLVKINTTNKYFELDRYGNSIEVVAIKLEPGNQQTLAHQENDIWVLNEIPDYETEYYKCVTSDADSTDTYANQKVSNITVQCNSVGSSSLRYYNNLIQSTHKVLDSTFSNPAAQTSDITVTTYDGYLDFSNGFASGATTNITLVLGTSGPVLSTSTTAPS